MIKLTKELIEKYFDLVSWGGTLYTYAYKRNDSKRIVTGPAWYDDGYITVFVSDKNHQQINTFEQLIKFLKQ